MFDERIVQLAAFRVGDEEYVIDIMRIKEIINPIKVTAVPGAPDVIEGVINLRGVILPLIDLRKRFGLPVIQKSRNTKYIIVLVLGRFFGMVVDEVLEVVRVPKGLINPVPKMFSGKEPGAFLGVCQYQDRMLFLLNLKKVFQSVLQIQPEPGPTNP
jgi:purine-binding chemotaxis protein CheW